MKYKNIVFLALTTTSGFKIEGRSGNLPFKHTYLSSKAQNDFEFDDKGNLLDQAEDTSSDLA